MNFKDAVKNTPVYTKTENGMRALASTLRNTTDLFFKIGASRGKNIISEFERAYQEDAELAVRIALWSRDARGGAGERQLFRDILLYLEKAHVEVLTDTKLLAKVPDLGRWDDLLVFTKPEIKTMAYSLILEALNNGDGLCAKWMPRQGADANKIRSYLRLTHKQYLKL